MAAQMLPVTLPDGKRDGYSLASHAWLDLPVDRATVDIDNLPKGVSVLEVTDNG